MYKEVVNRMRVLQWLVGKRMRNFVEVGTVFSQYRADPQAVLSRVEQEGETSTPSALFDTLIAGASGNLSSAGAESTTIA